MNRIIEYGLKFTGDTAQARQQIADLGKSATQLTTAFKQTDTATHGLIDTYDPLGAKLRKLKDDFAALDQAARKGLVVAKDDSRLDAAYANIKKQIKETEQAQLGYIATNDKTARSQKQLAQAMQQVPMQFSDIVISLQAGQSPMNVLLQQGSQLKDSFGGVGAAAKALGGYVVSLINPLTLAAAAGVAAALAFYQGSEESKNLANALVLSGNAAGTNVDNLYKLAAATAAATGGTKGAAVEALNLAVTSGKVTSDNLGKVAEAAIALKRTAGVAIEDTVKQFSELGKSPAEASLKLNEQYNYLTAEIYRQIKALQDEGREREAVTLAQKTYGDAAIRMAAAVEQNLGTLEKGWRSVADAAKNAWDTMLGIGRTKTISEELADVTAQIDAARRGLAAKGSSTDAMLDQDFSGVNNANLTQLESRKQLLQFQAGQEAEIAGLKAAQNEEEKAGIRFQQIKETYLTEELRRRREISNVRNTGQQAGQSESEIKALIAQVNKKYGKSAEEFRAAQFAIVKASAEAAMKLEQQQLTAAGEAYQHAYDLRLISIRNFYTAQAAIQDQGLAAQERSVKLELARAKENQVKATDPKDTSKHQAEVIRLEGELAVITEKRGRVSVDANIKTIDGLRTLKEELDAVRLKLAETMGNASPDQIAEGVRRRYKVILEQSKANAADIPGGTELVEKMIDVETAKERLQQIQGNWNRVIGAINAEEQRINILRENGLLGEISAREQIIELQRQAGAQLRDQIPMLDELAAKYPHLANEIANMKNEFLRLSSVTDVWTSTFNGAAKDAMAQFFTDATSGSKSFKQAALDALNAIRNAMVKLAAEKLADAIFKGDSGSGGAGGLLGLLGKIFGGGSSGGGGGNDVGIDVIDAGTFFAHTGAVIGHSGGWMRSGLSFSPAQIAAAPRYHSGGMIGSNERLLVGKVGEEVLTENDPRHVKNGGSMPQIHIHEAPGAKVGEVKSSQNGNMIEIFLEQADAYLAGNLIKGRGALTNALETVTPFSRGASTRGG